MGKKFQGKICVYCCLAKSSTADHVFAREFFLASRRDNLPKVPCCSNCNQNKAALEHYLTAVLPFGGRNVDNDLAIRDAARRLQRNLKLRRVLQENAKETWMRQSSGFFESRTLIPVDAKKIRTLVGYWVRGLFAHHWQALLGDDVDVRVFPLHSELGQVVDDLLREPARQKIDQNLGAGTFWYSASQALDDAFGSAWRFSILGGMSLHTEKSKAKLTHWAALTIPKGRRADTGAESS